MNKRYLELGIAKAKCFNRVAMCFQESVAVDTNLKAKGYITDLLADSTFYNDTTDDFFKCSEIFDVNKKFNLIFIDANHDFENVKKDFDNSIGVLEKNGILILHDTFSPSKEWDEHCQDAYKIIEYLDIHHYEAVTLPFYFGLTIVRGTH